MPFPRVLLAAAAGILAAVLAMLAQGVETYCYRPVPCPPNGICPLAQFFRTDCGISLPHLLNAGLIGVVVALLVAISIRGRRRIR
ncbi:MAG: hypothetical protein ACRENL_04915 [Candidatus Dormibacteria bacterium]